MRTWKSFYHSMKSEAIHGIGFEEERQLQRGVSGFGSVAELATHFNSCVHSGKAYIA